MFWAQGFSQAPWLVQRCIASWRHHNPDWNLILLDKSSVVRYVDTSIIPSHLELPHQSDLIRLQLLAGYGGVWADPTTLCRYPLNCWVDHYSSSGFFAFQRPGRDRLIANWFLACQPDCPVVVRLCSLLLNYWQQYQFHNFQQTRQWQVKLLSALLSQTHHTTRFWLSPLVCRWLQGYPYFIFHYAFASLICADAECLAIWRNTPYLSAKPSRLIERLGFHSHATSKLMRKAQHCRAPLFKLSWQYEAGNGFEETLLHQIISTFA